MPSTLKRFTRYVRNCWAAGIYFSQLRMSARQGVQEERSGRQPARQGVQEERSGRQPARQGVQEERSGRQPARQTAGCAVSSTLCSGAVSEYLFINCRKGFSAMMCVDS